MGQSRAIEDADRDAENKHAPEVPMADSSTHLVGPEPRAVPTQHHPSGLGLQHHSCLGYGSQPSSLRPLYPSSCPISLQSSEGHIVSQPRAHPWTLMSPQAEVRVPTILSSPSPDHEPPGPLHHTPPCPAASSCPRHSSPASFLPAP